MKRLLLLAVLFTLLSTSVLAASFLSGPIIQPLDARQPSIEDDLLCSWTPSIDVTQQNVTWYNGSTSYVTQSNIDFDTNATTLSSFIAKKGENWTCNVSIKNASTLSVGQVSVLIKNALPAPPTTGGITQLYEDHATNFTLVSSDSDNDPLTYSKFGSDPTFCSVNTNTGDVSCLPLYEDIGIINATYVVNDGGSYLAKTNITYTILSVNDPPQLTVSDQAATVSTAFLYELTVSDEEDDWPINFTLKSNLTTLQVISTGNNTATITFNRVGNAPIYSERGTWEVELNISDAGPTSNTPYDNNNNSYFFNLTITSGNVPPNITTNFSATTINGTQGSLLTFNVSANDIDVNDTLNFSIDSPCSLTNPWSILTLDSNATNATGQVNITLTNDHVVCNNVTITVNDGETTDSVSVLLNLTNTNDAPSIQTNSFHQNNTNSNYQITNITGVKGRELIYVVNATDPDELTYEGEDLTFSDNSSLFVIGPATGALSFTPNDSHVGNYSILVNVSDDEGLWSTAVMTINIINNTPPNITQYTNITCTQDTLCTAWFTAYDPDPSESLIFYSNNSAVFPLTPYNSTARLFNETLTNDDVGSYVVRVTVYDKYLFTDTSDFLLIVDNVNDAPFFDQDRNGVVDTVTLDDAVVDKESTLRVYATDKDLSLGIETLTFNWSFTTDPTNMSSNVSTTATGEDYFDIAFTPTAANAGAYVINFSVTDSQGATYWQEVSFDVLAKSGDPTVEEVRPYMNNVSGLLDNNFVNTSAYLPQHYHTIYLNENSAHLFDARALPDIVTVENNTLDYYWYYEGTLMDTLTNVTPGFNSDYTHTFTYYDQGLRNITLQIIDDRYAETSWTWMVNVTNINRAPQLINNLTNIATNSTITISDYFSFYTNLYGWQQQFYDIDDDLNEDGRRASSTGEVTNLTYSVSPGSSCSIATITPLGDDITVAPSTAGSCYLQFRAIDEEGFFVDSNFIWITVEEVTVEEVPTPTTSSNGGGATKTVTVPVPIEDPVDVPVALQIISPQQLYTYENDTVSIPLTISNNWTETMENIHLNATLKHNSTENFTTTFSVEDIAELQPGENMSITLTIGNYRKNAPLMAIIYATSESPEYTDQTTVMISSLEERSSGESVEEKISFARDLLDDNPECQELTELLDQAEVEQSQRNIEGALKLISDAVNGCKYLINKEIEAVEEQPKQFFTLTNLTTTYLPFTIVAIILLGSLLIFGSIMIYSGVKYGKRDKI